MGILSGLGPSFKEISGNLYRHRRLTIEMTKQDLLGRFAGQTFGVFWVVAHPMLLIFIYLFVFVVVFKQKSGGTSEMPRDFSTYLLSGLIPWMMAQEVMAKGVYAIISHANLVKQVVFPVEILPVKVVLAALLTQTVALSLLATYSAIVSESIPWTYILIPALIIAQISFLIGISFILSSVGTYFRDVKDLVQMFSVAGPFLIPAFYLPSQIPDIFRYFLFLNPFSYMVWVFQDVFYYGRIEHAFSWLVFGFISLATFIFGYRLFRRVKIMFGEVL